MNWLRLLEIIEMARRRTTDDPKRQRGFQWVCFCSVCCELRRVTT